MKRPTRREVMAAIKKDYPHGRIKYLEAVKLRSGIIIVEYEVRSPVSITHKPEIHVTHRVITIGPDGRYRNSMIVTSWWEKP